jgi:hypothetical protein
MPKLRVSQEGLGEVLRPGPCKSYNAGCFLTLYRLFQARGNGELAKGKKSLGPHVRGLLCGEGTPFPAHSKSAHAASQQWSWAL